MARRKEHSGHPPTTPSVVAPLNTEHQPEALSESTPPLAPLSSHPTSYSDFMPSLSVDTVPSKSDLPRSLKSTYGSAGVETPESPQETSTTAPTFDLAKQMKSEFVQPLLGATNDSPKLTRKEQAGSELNDISLVKQHGKRGSVQFEDHHKAKTDQTLLKSHTLKAPEYKVDLNEQTFTKSQGAMMVQDHQPQTVERSKTSEESSPQSQISQQSTLSSISPSHPTDSPLMSHRSSSSSPIDTKALLQPSPSHDVECNPLSGNSSSAAPRLKQQDIGFDISTLHSSRTFEDSDSADTETDEESRGSVSIPPGWSLSSANKRKPREHPNMKRVSNIAHVDRENSQLESSGFVEVSTGGAWNQKKKQTRTSGWDKINVYLAISVPSSA